MTSNLKKIFLTIFIVICSIFFINIDNVKALGDGNGYAVCSYFMSQQSTTGHGDGYQAGSTTANRPYIIKVVFYKDGNNYMSYADIGCGDEQNYGYTETKKGICKIDNYNDIFHHADDYKAYFNSGSDNNPNWTCPSYIYLEMLATRPTMKVYLNEDKCPFGGCFSMPLSENSSQQSGNPPTEVNVEGYDTDVADYGAGIGIDQGAMDKNNSPSVNVLDKIEDWANGQKNKDDDSPTVDVCDIVSQSVLDTLSLILWIATVGGIILLIVLTIIEFIKVLTGQDDEGLKKAFKNTLIRAACVVILLLLPLIIIGIIEFINENNHEINADGSYKIGADGNPICKVNE